MMKKTSVVKVIEQGVTLVAVTKTFPFQQVQEAYDSGIRDIGENRVGEAEEKITQAKKSGMNDIIWHMIGHVQSRKTHDVVRLFNWVDSVDSLELLKKLDSEVSGFNKKLHILFEVNLTGEPTKYGFDLAEWKTDPNKLNRFFTVVLAGSKLPYVVLEGLMTMAPYVTHAEDNRLIFRSMGELSKVIREKIPAFNGNLSMGTSCDYEVAIQEGATQVRLGEALFGKRLLTLR